MRSGGFAVFLSILIVLFVPVPSLQWIARSILVLVGFSFLYSRLIQKYLWVERGQEQFFLYRRKTGEVRLILTNYLPLPIPGVLIADEPGGLLSDGRERQIRSLSPGERYPLEYNLTPQDRGLYTLGPVTLIGSDPLGFFPWQKTLELGTPVLVFPRIHSLSLLLDQGSPTGPIESTNPLHTDPNLVRSYRDYQPGDDPRLISWKLSARTQHFQVAQFLQTLAAPAVILVNLDGAAYAGRRDFHHSERAIEAAASAIQFWIHSGESCALITNGTFPDSDLDITLLPFGKGLGHTNALLAALAAVQRRTGPVAPGSPAASGAAVAPSGSVVAPTPPGSPAASGAAVAPPPGSPAPGAAATVLPAPTTSTQQLFATVPNLRPGPGTRVVYIGPAPRQEDFLAGIQSYPRTWALDLWVLDELNSYEHKVAPGMHFPDRSVTCVQIRDQGEEIFE